MPGSRTREIFDVEEKYGALTPNGESAQQYLEKEVIRMHRRHYLSDKERDGLLAFIQAPDKKNFVMPKSKAGREQIYNALYSLSQKKPAADVFAVLQATSTHVQTAGEIFSYLFENSAELGTFNENPRDKRKTNTFGYLARTHKHEWKNLMEYFSSLGGNYKKAVKVLAGVDEYSDFYKIFLKDLAYLSTAEKKTVLGEIENLINELRPNNYKVVEGEGFDIVEYHLYAASQYQHPYSQ